VRRAALALALVLAGCPIPQPLPDYPPGTITPPRILVDEIAGDGNPIIFVPSFCVTTPVYKLSARIFDSNTIETVDTRWFVNYDSRSSLGRNIWDQKAVPPNADTTNLTRDVPPLVGGVQQGFEFVPYDHPATYGAPPVGGGPVYPDPGIVRVVELVVSNGFDPSVIGTAELSNRAPKPGFETQVHRWVFLSVPESAEHPCPPP